MSSEDGTGEPFRSAEAGAMELQSKSPGHRKTSSLGSPERRKSSIPILFERSAHSWWNPQFDSKILEEQHQKTSSQNTKKKFRFALGYVVIACIVWSIFFGVMNYPRWHKFLIGGIVLLALSIAVLLFSYTRHYKRFILPTSIVYLFIICLFNLLSFVSDDHIKSPLSAVGTFTVTVEILLMTYTLIPLPLYLCIGFGTTFSITYEVLSAVLSPMGQVQYIVARVLIHVVIHVIGIHLFIMAQVRRRSTFLKVGQSILSRRELHTEKQLKHKMINSLMPPKVAEEVMKQRNDKEKDEDEDEKNKKHMHSRSPDNAAIKFRSFHMSQMDNVSILFADIVGFTKMSSNKTAEHLVSLLNDLFGRFDIICTKSGCEKISTLGDCYYCVSGCPEARPDHAKCCVDMGLAMIIAIKEFDEDHNEAVNMRVGVHTGTVLCGIVGTRRFKFDVWSHDVTLANTMESEGKPGCVHISESTYKFIKDDYDVDVGEEVEDIRKHKVLIEDYNAETQQYVVRHVRDNQSIKTYFITGTKNQTSSDLPQNGADTVVKSDGEDSGVKADNIRIVVSTETGTKQQPAPEVSSADGVSQEGATNHLGDKVEESTAELLNKRENLATSLEDISGDTRAEESGRSGVVSIGMPSQTHRHPHGDSDNQLIECIRTETKIDEYLYSPPINKFTLNFHNPVLERKYRNHYVDDVHDVMATFALPRYSALCDMVVSFLFFCAIAICCFLGFGTRAIWIVVFVIALLVEILMLLPVFCDVCCRSIAGASSLNKLGRFFSHWVPGHIFGCIIASLPVAAIFSNFSCMMFYEEYQSDFYYCVIFIASLLHYCNFTMLSSWLKSSLASVAAIMLLILLRIGICHSPESSSIATRFIGLDNLTTSGDLFLTTMDPLNNDTMTSSVFFGLTNDTMTSSVFFGDHRLKDEIIPNIILLLLLIWFLNREFEISYRVCFHGDVQAAKNKKIMQQEKELADWLHHNIIPEHVSEVLKQTSQYCKNHKDIGVIFAKIVNYDDFYDESFEGGKEYLRVLNELMGDFEDLFDNPKYKDVEKIKTIGSCLMAASGLNPATRNRNKDPNAHLYALVDFSVDILQKLEQFNSEIFNFDFEMAIGYNFGEVTAGVIGTTKLLYDIWGDTVNVSSRMYSTGKPGKIQVTEDCAKKLEDQFDFEYRGKIFVKGKGDLNTYILKGKKSGACWE